MHGNAPEGGGLHQEEIGIIAGALKYRDMLVEEVMTPISKVFMLPASGTLNFQTIAEIFHAGYSRIPVYDKDKSDIIGLILVKDLIFIDPEDETPIKRFVDLFGRTPCVVWHDEKLGETLKLFKSSRSHMGIVRDVVEGENGKDSTYTVVGIITLEDIIEEILGSEIEDEFEGENIRGVHHYADEAGQSRDVGKSVI